MGVDAATAARIARLERQIAYLYRHLGLDPLAAEAAGPVLPPDFEKMLRDGKLIGAIKIYRDVTGAGLAEAKNEVERIARQRGY